MGIISSKLETCPCWRVGKRDAKTFLQSAELVVDNVGTVLQDIEKTLDGKRASKQICPSICY